MDLVHERCAGIDIGKTDCKVCIRVPGRNGRRHTEIRTFTTVTEGLLALREWLVSEQITLVGMEATGAYWKPVYYLLEEHMETWLLNAQHMRNVPGRKTDVRDCQWICQLIEHGLVRPSFVPPKPIRHLRDLTRYRTEITRERTRELQRLEKLLEDPGIKLSSVVSDLGGKSARTMVEALIVGERDPRTLARLAVGALKDKEDQLTQALTGFFTEHHAFLARAMLVRIDAATATVKELTAEIDRRLEPYRHQLELLVTIPGISITAAQVVVAEIGVDMQRFPTAGHLASWAGVCPGNHESAGKVTSGRTRHGDAWLKGVLGNAAAAAARSKNTYLAAQFRRLVGHRGKKRALVALEHSILVAVWHILTRDMPYQDLGADHFINRIRKSRQTRRLVGQLTQLGYDVSLEPRAT
ncbi:IS110 family RNA-guided transposase [Streptomyces mirabilis]|uniref:IS110 family transposase n=1 Tax=Streptomyces mirabilis TaxID=68239 RepID=UPI0036DF1CA6